MTDGSSTGDSSITLVFASSEVTTNFDASDIQVNGYIEFQWDKISTTGMTYTATFTPRPPVLP